VVVAEQMTVVAVVQEDQVVETQIITQLEEALETHLPYHLLKEIQVVVQEQVAQVGAVPVVVALWLQERIQVDLQEEMVELVAV
tara:strand:+ start:175 stop:426 length:252 start_codon:yes stop_codon:yes gene_type:complete